MPVQPKAAEVPDALLRRLGDSGIRIGHTDLVDVLAPAYPDIVKGAERRSIGGDD